MFTYLVYARYIAHADEYWSGEHFAVLWGLGVFCDTLLLAFLWVAFIALGLLSGDVPQGQAVERLERFRKALQKLDGGLLVIGGMGLVTLIGITCLSAMGRYTMGVSIPDDITLAEWAMVGCVSLMIGTIQGRGEHIEVTALTDRMGPGANKMLRLLGLLIGVFIVGRFALINFEEVPDAFLEETYGSIYELPLWPARLLFEIGLIWWLFRIMVQAVIAPITFLRPPPPQHQFENWNLTPLLPAESGHESELTTQDFLENDKDGT